LFFIVCFFFFFSSRRRHTRFSRDWSSDVCSSDLSNPAEFQLPAYSDSYAVVNAQISRNFNKKIRAYLGGENLTSYMQKNAIVDFKNPFGNYFDGGMVYAPIMKANLYVGLDVTF